MARDATGSRLLAEQMAQLDSKGQSGCATGYIMARIHAAKLDRNRSGAAINTATGTTSHIEYGARTVQYNQPIVTFQLKNSQ